jgi:glycosyltransferase involved in cell wall biosynthesis
MRITIAMGFFLPVPPVDGGATEKSWHELALEFARQGHEVTILSRRRPGWPDLEVLDGVRHVRLRGYPHTRRLAANLWLDFLWSIRVTRALPSADVTISNCVALPLWLARIRRAGKVVVLPGRLPKGQYRFYGRIDRVLASSSVLKAAVVAEKPRLAPRISVCGYPIPWAILARSRPAQPPGAPLTIGYVGRIHREKGLDLFAAALAELARRPGLPAWRVLLCGPQSVAQGGSGEAYARGLERALAASLPAGAFEFHPPIFVADRLADLYRGIDVFCYPSLSVKGETFGVAVAEAMAAGAVPVVSDLPCFADFVRPGETGEVFDAAGEDAAARLAGALALVLSDPARRARLAGAARAAVRRYDTSVLAASLLADFSTLK